MIRYSLFKVSFSIRLAAFQASGGARMNACQWLVDSASEPKTIPALLLFQNFLVYQSFEMRKFIGHMRQLHGFHKFLLEIAFNRQLNVFDIA